MKINSSTLKHIGILMIVLGVLSTVISGFILKSLVLGLTSLISAFISAAIYYALAEILDNQEKIISDLYRISKDIHNTKESNEQFAPQYNAPPPTNNVGDKWVCKNCGETNPRNIRICKSCGHDK